MPHVIIEYSDDLVPVPDIDAVLVSIHGVIVELVGAPISNVKSRAYAVHSLVGDADPSRAMVHAEIALMEGRTRDAKAALAEAVVGILRDAFAPASSGRDVQTTVEVRDIERATYAKHPPGTISTPPLP